MVMCIDCLAAICFCKITFLITLHESKPALVMAVRSCGINVNCFGAICHIWNYMHIHVQAVLAHLALRILFLYRRYTNCWSCSNRTTRRPRATCPTKDPTLTVVAVLEPAMKVTILLVTDGITLTHISPVLQVRISTLSRTSNVFAVLS